MKKTGLLLWLALSVAAAAQDVAPATGAETPPRHTSHYGEFPNRDGANTDLCRPLLRWLSQQAAAPEFQVCSWRTPNSHDDEIRQRKYDLPRRRRIPDRQEYIDRPRDDGRERYQIFRGQLAMVRQAGQLYSELARVRIVDTRRKMAIAQIEFSCDPVNPGDFAIPFVRNCQIPFHPQIHFDRFLPRNNQVTGRILLAKDYDSELGTGFKVYLNIGSNQGVKIGDYFRAVRSYTADLQDPVDSLSFKASTRRIRRRDLLPSSQLLQHDQGSKDSHSGPAAPRRRRDSNHWNHSHDVDRNDCLFVGGCPPGDAVELDRQ